MEKVILLGTLLFGCVSVTPEITQDGNIVYKLSCFTKEQCFARSEDLCLGYEIIKEWTEPWIFPDAEDSNVVDHYYWLIKC